MIISSMYDHVIILPGLCSANNQNNHYVKNVYKFQTHQLTNYTVLDDDFKNRKFNILLIFSKKEKKTENQLTEVGVQFLQ